MPVGPQGQKRPADAIGAAIKVARIAIGEETEEESVSSAAAEMGRRGGKKRAENLSATRRSEIARKAAAARYSKE